MAIATGINNSLTFAEEMLSLLNEAGVPIFFATPDAIQTNDSDTDAGLLLQADAFIRNDFLSFFDEIVAAADKPTPSQINFTNIEEEKDPVTGDTFKISEKLNFKGNDLTGQDPNISSLAISFNESETSSTFSESGAGKYDIGLAARPFFSNGITYNRLSLSETFKGGFKGDGVTSAFSESFKHLLLGNLAHTGNRISGNVTSLNSSIAIKSSETNPGGKFNYDEKSSLALTGSLTASSGENEASVFSGQINALKGSSVVKVTGTASASSPYSEANSYSISYDSKELITFSDLFAHADKSAAEAFAEALFSKNDMLTGTSLDDRINGFAGNDIITGGKGSDELSGGSGNDLFIFKKGDSLETDRDLITDLRAGDRIQLAIKLKALSSVSATENGMDATAAVNFTGKNSVVLVVGNDSSAVYLDLNGDRVIDEVIEIAGVVSAALNNGLIEIT